MVIYFQHIQEEKKKTITITCQKEQQKFIKTTTATITTI